jgi:ribose 5-phosphate isomerase B
MTIVISSDHAGFRLKEWVIKNLKAQNIMVKDAGTDSEKAVDYPDFAKKLGDIIIAGYAHKGILICGSGVGACIAANKIKGIRASVCHDTYSAHQGVEHDDMNVLVLGARIIGEALAWEIINRFLEAKFSNEERHLRRLNKILYMENI